LEFLDGKKFIYRGRSIGFWCQDLKRSVRELSNAIITSPNVIEVKLAGFDNPEALIAICDLVEKLPNCSGIQLAPLTITENTAPYLAKLVSILWLRMISLQQATFTRKSCQTFADLLDPDRFAILSLEECDIPTIVPILKVLERAKISAVPYLVNRQLSDDEFNGLTNVIKNNKHLQNIYVSHLANLQSRMLAEAMLENTSAKEVTFTSCDLVTAVPAIVKLLQTTEIITSFCISSCSLTLALLTELCEGLKERKSTADLNLLITEVNYTDSLEPIQRLLEDNVQLPTLSLMVGSSPKEWIQIFESLKKNTTLNVLNISCVQANNEMMDVLLEALKVNTGLRSLYLDTRLYSPVLDSFIVEIVSKNKIEFAHFASGELRDLDFKTICSMLKRNFRLKKINLALRAIVPNTEENIKIFKELLEENCFITSYGLMQDSYYLVEPYTERNQKYQEEWKQLKLNATILLHNLARNADETRKMLHTDLWIEIFKRIRHACSPINGFEKYAKKIFKRYNVY
jgi:hypothetical protein